MEIPRGQGLVIAVCRSQAHTFTKPVQNCIRLIEGLGVEDDAHLGAIVLSGGEVRPRGAITLSLPPEPHHQLDRV